MQGVTSQLRLLGKLLLEKEELFDVFVVHNSKFLKKKRVNRKVYIRHGRLHKRSEAAFSSTLVLLVIPSVLIYSDASGIKLFPNFSNYPLWSTVSHPKFKADDSNDFVLQHPLFSLACMYHEKSQLKQWLQTHLLWIYFFFLSLFFWWCCWGG